MSETPWVDGLTFGGLMETQASQFADSEAIVFPQLNVRWTYSQFREEVILVAKSLVSLGVGSGDHIGIWCTNWPQWILIQFATAHIGAILVNVNPAYRAGELEFILRHGDIHTLVLTDTYKDSNYEAMATELVPHLREVEAGEPLATKAFPVLRHVVSIKDTPSVSGILSWPQFTASVDEVSDEQLAERANAVRPLDPVNIQYTSGTTGAPKGAMLSHRNLLLNAFYAGQRLRLTPDDRVCMPFPFYHCAGCVLGTLTCVVHGATMVVASEAFEPDPVLEAVQAEKCTALHGVPTMFSAELHSPNLNKYDLSTLRTGLIGGSPCPVELMKQVVDRLHLPEITIAYGLTEASPLITHAGADETLEVRTTTVGSLLPGVEGRIVDPVTLEDVSSGEQGEFWTKGHNVMLGYYKQPEATAEAIVEDGWLRTGDLAVRTPGGHYHITGRSKDVIIRGGENIYPTEVEEFLLGHPLIQDVQVVGLPDAQFGEEVSAWVVLNDGNMTQEDLRLYCKEKMAHYKIPRYVAFVDEFPLTVTGKVLKYKLRDMGIEKFGLEDAASIATA